MVINPDLILELLRESVEDERWDAVAEDFWKLDEWLSNGGSPPKDWMKHERWPQ